MTIIHGYLALMMAGLRDWRQFSASNTSASWARGRTGTSGQRKFANLAAVAPSIALAALGMLPTTAAAQACPPNVISSSVLIDYQLLIISDCAISSSGVLTINLPGSLTTERWVRLSNFGSLVNNAGLFNWGTLANWNNLINNGGLSNTGTLSNAGGLDNNGILTNLNVLENKRLAGLANFGTLTNSAIFSNAGNLNNYATMGTFSLLTNSGQLFNFGAATFENGGTLDNTGQLGNTGQLTNNMGAQLNNFGSLINHARGTLTNSGSLATHALLSNFGTLQNNAMLSNAGRLNNERNLTNLGTLSNSGLLTNSASGTLLNFGGLHNSLELENSGLLVTSMGMQLINRADATLNNYRGGILNNAGVLANEAGGVNGAVLNNYGTLNNTGNVIVIGALGTGSAATLNNWDKLNNAGLLEVTRDHASAGQFAGVVNNYGKLNNTGALVNDGFLRVASLVDNVNPPIFGEMTNSAEVTNHLTLVTDPGTTLSNSGTLTNNSLIYNGGFLSNAGTLNNGLNFSNDGHLTNEGGTAGSAGATLNNQDYLENGGFGNFSVMRNNGGTGLGSGGAILNNHGVLETRTLFVNGAGTAGGDAAVLNNYGRLVVYQSGSELRNDGAIINSGIFQIEQGAKVTGTGSYVQTAGVTFVDVDGELSASSVQFLGGALVGEFLIDPPSQILIGSDAFVRPGSSIGTGTFLGNAQFNGELDIQIAGLASHDVLKVIGAIDFGAGAKIVFIFEGYAPQLGDNFSFLDAGALSGFGNVTFLVAGLDAGFDFQLRDAGNGKLELFTAMAPAVPEPGAWLLIMLGLGVIGLARQRVIRASLRRD